jgi:hypothetical protein
MRDHRLSVRAAFLVLTAGAALSGCAPRYMTIGSHADTDEAPTVEVRDLPHTSTVSVLAWSPTETAYGNRSSFRRDGLLLAGYHRIYVNTFAVNERFFSQAWTTTRPLRIGGISRDPYYCASGGDVCSPYETFGALVLDKVLRANRDSLPVTFYGRNGALLNVTLHRDVIDAYLTTVDSVSSALRVKWDLADGRTAGVQRVAARR